MGPPWGTTRSGRFDGLDTDAAPALRGSAYLLPFDITGAIRVLVCDDEDVLRSNGISWTLAFDGSGKDQ